MWSKVIVVLAGTIAVTGSDEEIPSERIYGGSLANITNYPYQVKKLSILPVPIYYQKIT